MGSSRAKNPWGVIRIFSKRFYCGFSERIVDVPVDARIVKTGFDPEISRFNFKLKDLVRANQIAKARQLFDEMPYRNTSSVNMMVSGYVKSRNLFRARELFDSMFSRNEVSWTIMIGGYSQNNQPKEAFNLYTEMCRSGVKPDHITFATLLSGFDDTTTLKEVLQIHSHIIRFGFSASLIVFNSLVDSYCKTCCLDVASQLFSEMPTKDSVSFNVMITGYTKYGFREVALKLFMQMRNMDFQPSGFTFAAMLGMSVGSEDVIFGQQIHGLAIKTSYVWDIFVANALLDFYSKHDYIDLAKNLFDEMPELDGVSYNIIITGYAWNGQYEKSFDLFKRLQGTSFDRKNFPFATMLSVAAIELNLSMGRQTHAQAVVTTAVSEVQVGNALVDMYAKCEKFEDANRIFANLAYRNSVPWTAIISIYVQKGFHEEALKMFKEMNRENVHGDQATFASTLKASANLASVSLGKQLHSSVIRLGLLSSVFSGSVLVDMYANCGSMKDAIEVFKEMPDRNIVCWNALISAYAQNGDAEATFSSFADMIESGLYPDSVSFLSVLTACSHRGLVEKALWYFNSMTQVYKLDPRRKHYATMIDVLCRSGRFNEAENLISEMPFEPDEVMWSSVLNSCRIHKNQDLAKKAADQLFKMDALRDAAAYVNMSNIYAEAGKWENAAKVKKAMRERGVKKVTAYSWVEIDHRVHVFTANDRTHPQTEQIRRKINSLVELMDKEGYKPDTSCTLQNVDEEMKIESLKYHSERLSIAFALINTPEGSPIIIMKNLRACVDCHAAIKVISKIVGREITMRDSILYGSKKDALDYVKWVKDDKLFHLLVQRLLSSWGHTFPRLKLQYKPPFSVRCILPFVSFLELEQWLLALLSRWWRRDVYCLLISTVPGTYGPAA
ncbi:hypothetical protein MTR67_014457 [Solanum verrucosum]|uniref:DYW domain-containing protein n=1 Tax=Solanum verrucosum TaxID=315347 RepID=A0AAF0QC91_SOLVR|nr:hypothetical protein MTR67_014457 [Solanum verrucosum]